MDIKKEEEKRKIEEQRKHPMIDLADSVNRSTIGGLSNLAEGNLLTRIMTVVIIVIILVFIGFYVR